MLQMCVLGECMVEISAEDLTSSNVSAGLSYGGDTLNTCVYFARLGGDVSYLSALGDDALSGWMLDCWREEGVGCDLVQRHENANPGLYLIQVDDTGERSFAYWRQNSAARALLQSAEQLTELLRTALAKTDLLYLSGISLSLMSEAARSAFFALAQEFRGRGGLVAFDSNHRQRLWPDNDTAKFTYERMYATTDIALSTAEDEYMLYGEGRVADVVDRLQSLGVAEIVVKDGMNGCQLHTDGKATQVPAIAANVVDTTAAGDSFNAAYLHARASGRDAHTAVKCGHVLAGTVIGHRGAIIPAAAMPGSTN